MQGKTGRLTLDLAALPKGAKVHHASLYCFTQNNGQPNDPVKLHVTEKLEADGTPVPAGDAFAVEGPWYRSFDITAAVKMWLAQPEKNLGIAVLRFDKLVPNRSYVEILYEGAARNLPPQAGGVKVAHHDGQSFIIWKEHAEFVPKPADVIWIDLFSEKGDKLAEGPGQGVMGLPRLPGITLKTLRELQGIGLRDKPSGFQGIKPLVRVRPVPDVKYRIYRHTEKIAAATLPRAQLIAEAEPLNGYDDDMMKITFHGEYIDQMEVGTSPLPMFCYEDGKAITPGEGLYVHTTRESGKFYYAVTLSLAGTENVAQLSDDNSLAQAVEEKLAPPKPVLQFMQQDRYKDDVNEEWYKYWGGPPYYHLPSRMFRIAVGVPKKYAPPGPMSIINITGSFNTREALNLPSSTAITLAIESVNSYTPDLCYNEGRGTLRANSECKVDYFAERHMLNLIDWGMKKWNADRTRISGNMLHFGIRHPEIFAKMEFGAYTATYDMRWAPGSPGLPSLLGPKGGAVTVDGDDAWLTADIGWYMKKYPARDIPFLMCVSAVGKDSGHTSEFGWQDDPRGWRALLDARQTFVASWGSEQGRAWTFPGELSQGFAKMRWDVSIPAFSNCSLDNNPGNGDPADGDPCGQINGYTLWEDNGQADEAERWEVTVYLVPSTPYDTCSVDVTPRHCKAFKPKAGEKFKWSATDLKDNKALQSGEVIADEHGLVTLRAVPVTKSKVRIKIGRN